MMDGLGDLISNLNHDFLDKLRKYVDFYIKNNKSIPIFSLDISLNPSTYKGLDYFILNCKNQGQIIWSLKAESLDDIALKLENKIQKETAPQEINVGGKRYRLVEE